MIFCREVLNGFREVLCGQAKKSDVHTRLMKKYKQVPMWWFLVVLVINMALIIFVCEHYLETFQLPWWGALIAFFIAFIFTLPIGIIVATTNQVIHSPEKLLCRNLYVMIVMF